MKSLADLKRLSFVAVKFYNLISIAAYANYPSTAYNVAIRLDWNKKKAASCRFLSIILRDYGYEEFRKFIENENPEAYEEICLCDCHLRKYDYNYFLNLDDDCECDCCGHNECFHAAHIFDYECEICNSEEENDDDETDCSECKCYECNGDACEDCEDDECSECKCSDCEGDACDYCENSDTDDGDEEIKINEDEKVEEWQVRKVKRIFHRLQKITGDNYPIVILESDEKNAFADGNSITITTGILEDNNDDEIAWVLSHEIAHNKMKHTEQRIERIKELLGDVSVAFHGTKGLFKGVISAAARGITKHALNREIDRDEELIADKMAKEITEKAGFDSSKAEDFLSKTQGGGKIFSTHPSKYQRIKNLK